MTELLFLIQVAPQHLLHYLKRKVGMMNGLPPSLKSSTHMNANIRIAQTIDFHHYTTLMPGSLYLVMKAGCLCRKAKITKKSDGITSVYNMYLTLSTCISLYP